MSVTLSIRFVDAGDAARAGSDLGSSGFTVAYVVSATSASASAEDEDLIKRTAEVAERHRGELLGFGGVRGSSSPRRRRS